MITALDELIEAWVEMLENLTRGLGIDWLVDSLIQPLLEPAKPVKTSQFAQELTEHGGIEL